MINKNCLEQSNEIKFRKGTSFYSFKIIVIPSIKVSFHCYFLNRTINKNYLEQSNEIKFRIAANIRLNSIIAIPSMKASFNYYFYIVQLTKIAWNKDEISKKIETILLKSTWLDR